MLHSIEPLEGRRLLSTTPMLDVSLDANGVLTVNNAANVNVHEFLGNGADIPDSVVVTSPQIATFTGSSDNSGTYLGVTQIVINGTTGDDVVSLDDANIKAFINTGNGKDTIYVTNVAETTVNDPDLVTINAGNGKDSIVADTTGDAGTITTIVLSKGTDSVEAPFA
jgi:hypothetical protein